MLAFALIAALSSSFAFGLVPALQISRIDLNEVLKQAGRGASRAAGARARASLIVFETAAAVVLVIAASLLVRSFAALSAADMGFDTARLLIADTSVPASDVESARRAILFYHDLVPRLAQVPGVVSASAVSAVPTVVKSNGGYVIEGGRTFEQMGTSAPQALFTVVTPEYFRTIGITIKSGRDVSDADVEGAPLVAVVNEAFRRAAFGGGEAIGQRLMTGMDLVTGPDGTRFARIVGVVADVRSTDPSLAAQPQIYVPYQQHPNFSTALTLVLRTAADPLQAAAQTQQIIRALNPDVPVKVSTMESTLGVAVSAPRFRTILLALFAALALVLAMAGVYGLVSFTVSQRTGEMGLRMALGAQRTEIVRMTLASGVKLTALGCAIGWLAAFGLARVLRSMLYEVPARDPVVFVAAPIVLLAVACLASMAPALRASRVDPSVALRVD
jgi:putative ABC transport system permease protein